MRKKKKNRRPKRRQTMSLGPLLLLLRLLLLVSPSSPVVLSPRRFVSPLRLRSVWLGGGIAVVSPFGTPIPTPRAVAHGGSGVVVVSVVVVVFA